MQLTDFAFTVPNLKAVAALPSANPLPVTVTPVPPAVEPLLGATLSTTGRYLNRSLLEARLVPAMFVTLTSTIPAAPAGTTAVIEVGELTVNAGASVWPKSTLLAAVNSVPLTITLGPPTTGPDLAESLVTVGGRW